MIDIADISQQGSSKCDRGEVVDEEVIELVKDTAKRQPVFLRDSGWLSSTGK
jgi:hypothetical protein